MSSTEHEDGWEVIQKSPPRAVEGVTAGDAAAAEANGPESGEVLMQEAPLKPGAAADVFTFRIKTPTGTEVPMTLGVSDNAATIRHALADVFDVACETSYTLQLVPEGDSNEEHVVLNLYASLGEYEGMQEGAVVRMVRQPYDAHTAQAHVRRLREVLTSPPSQPNAVTVSPAPAAAGKAGDKPEAATEKSVPAADATPSGDAPAAAPAATKEKEKGGAGEEGATRRAANVPTLPILEVPVPVRLSDVFTAPSVFQIGEEDSAASGSTSGKGKDAAAAPVPASLYLADDVPAVASFGPAAILKSRNRHAAPLPQCLKSLTFSGWNPVPAHRRLLGDLFYVEAVTLDNVTLNITATTAGFFVNRSHRDCFNPSPASTAYHSYSLVALLSAASPRFRKAYAQLGEIVAKESAARADVPSPSSPAPMYFLPSVDNRAAGDAVGFAGAVSGYAFSKPSWLIPSPLDVAGASTVEAIMPGSVKEKEKEKEKEKQREALAVSGGHTFDPARAEESFGEIFGLADKGTLRDWNEEYQNYVDFNAVTVQDRVNKSRFITKIQADFVEAAVRGAMAIVDGHIPPLNPAEDPNSFVYVFNNIFYTRSMDTRQRVRVQREKRARAKAGLATSTPGAPPESDDCAFDTPTNHDLAGVIAVNRAGIKGLHTLQCTCVDYMGTRLVAQSIIPGILQGENATKLVYGSTDNGKTVAGDPTFHGLMQQLSEKLLVGSRVVTPLGKPPAPDAAVGDAAVVPASGPASIASDKPTELIGPVECKGILGADGRYYVLDLVRVTPRDSTYYDALPAEDKTVAPAGGEVGDAEEAEEEAEYRRAYVALLRPELVQAFAQYKFVTAEKSAEGTEGASAATVAASSATEGASESKAAAESATEPSGAEQPTDEAANLAATDDEAAQAEVQAAIAKATAEVSVAPLRFNVNVFTKFASLCDASALAEDEELARDAAGFLKNFVIPATVEEFRRGIIPHDGAELVEKLHSNGVNLRYLGVLANLSEKLEATGAMAPCALELLEQEIVARTVRRLLRTQMQINHDIRACPAPLFATVLSCLLGAPTPATAAAAGSGGGVAVEGAAKAGKGKKKSGSKKSGGVSVSASGYIDVITLSTRAVKNLGFTHESLWARVEADVSRKYGYELKLWGNGGFDNEPSTGAQAHARRSRIAPIAALRRIAQLTGLQLFSREFDFASSATTGAGAVVRVEDVAGMVPVVKHAILDEMQADVSTLLTQARLRLSAGQLQLAIALASEALLGSYTVVGTFHRGTAQCHRTLAIILWAGGDAEGAIGQQQRTVWILEKSLGSDHPETALAHANLASFLSACDLMDAAIRHMRRAVYVLDLSCGPTHRETVAAYMKMAMLYQEIAHASMAIACFQAALSRSRRNLPQAAACFHGLAVSHSIIGQFTEAVEYEKRCFQLYRERHGDNDNRTLESLFWLKTFAEKDRSLAGSVVKGVIPDAATAAAAAAPGSAKGGSGGKRGQKNKSR